MAATVLVRGGPELLCVELAPRRYHAYRIAEDSEEAAVRIARGYPTGLPVELIRNLRGLGRGELACADPDLLRVLASAGLSARPPTSDETRAALQALPAPPAALEREFVRSLARARVRQALRSDEEALVALAREEERVERVRNREAGAAEQFLAAEDGPLAEYSQDWTAERSVITAHHERLEARLEEVAARTVPNLTRLLGARVAARLVALAGGRPALARMSAGRLQLLGSRRRPGGGRGPRFGVLYRAARMSDVPRDRQGRFARSLAALAVIAARADGLTHRDLGPALVARRDRRIERLRRRP